MNDEKIRYAVVGAGNIAQVAILPAFEHASDNSRLVAVVSGSDDKRGALRQKYGLECEGDYVDFETILEDADIDAVYIATPNSLHKEFALRAAERSVHVLCEKPLAATADDCMTMARACRNNAVKLMVAYRLHFEQATLSALELARSGKLGELKLFSSSFTHVVREGDIRTNPDLAGGSGFDLGVYCINTARNLFDAEPIWVLADSIEKQGTDDTTLVILGFPGDKRAQFCVSNSTANVSSYRILGTNGNLRVEPGYDYVDELVHYLTLGDGPTERTVFKRGDQFGPQIAYFSDCILHDREPEPSAEEGWCDVRVVQAILESARGHKPVELAPVERRRRPEPSQVEHARPVQKPKTVRAPSASVK